MMQVYNPNSQEDQGHRCQCSKEFKVSLGYLRLGLFVVIFHVLKRPSESDRFPWLRTDHGDLCVYQGPGGSGLSVTRKDLGRI